MMRLDQLLTLAKTQAVADLRKDLITLTLQEKIQTIKNISVDTVAALNLHTDNEGSTHLAQLPLVITRGSEYFKDAITLLSALEVPHYNLYDTCIMPNKTLLYYLVDIGCSSIANSLQQMPGYFDCLEHIAYRVSDIDHHDTTQSTPLQNAVMGCQIDIVRLLLGQGADPMLTYGGMTCDELVNKFPENNHLRPDFPREYLALRAELELKSSAQSPKSSRGL